MRASLRDGETIALTPKAFDTLRYLAEHPDELVTKEQLLKAIWRDVIVGDASVKVCVREIRSASSTMRRSRHTSRPCTAAGIGSSQARDRCFPQ